MKIFKTFLYAALPLLIFICFLSGCVNFELIIPEIDTDFERGMVTRVVDGDTAYILFSDGTEEKVRFIGVDAPEINHATKGKQFYGPESESYTRSQLDGKEVWVEFDQEPRDQYGRLLAYIWLELPENISDHEIRDKMFNARLLTNGYASQVIFKPNVLYVDFFSEYESEARDAGIGLWQGKE